MGVERQVEFLGPQPKQKLPALYQEADLFVFPALRDSGGSALLEAMELGLPVLCFPWGGPAEMVDEETGFLVSLQTPARTVQEIRSTMRRVRSDPEAALQRAQKARTRVAEKFSWEEKRALLAVTYDELVSNS
jgi:glycosyltransferase involved in cell wall biosynthesis